MTNTARRDGELCTACGEGRLSSHVEMEQFEYGGTQGQVPMHYSVCNHCGSELTGATEARVNKRAANAFKKEVDRLLSGAAICAFRKTFGLSQSLAAQLFGGGKIAFSRYENDDIVQSEAMDSLLWLCSMNPANVALLAEKRHLALSADVQALLQQASMNRGELSSTKLETVFVSHFSALTKRAGASFSQNHEAALGKFTMNSALPCNDQSYLDAA